MSRRQRTRRRRSYGRRQHELRQRRPRHDLDALARESIRSIDESLIQREPDGLLSDDRAAA